MACIINASTSNGIVNSADGSGQIKVQSNGVTTNALAWVNFNGTGTVAIRSSYNVSSITDNGTGTYTINFTNAMADTNYTVIGSACRFDGGSGNTNAFPVVLSLSGSSTYTSKLTTSAQILTVLSASPQDTFDVNIAVFGN